MSVTSHKSIQSLAIYQKVKADEKLNMGISLMYNLLNPEDALQIHEKMRNDHQNPADEQPALEPPPKKLAIEAKQNQPERHTLDPKNTNILPLDTALQPYKPPEPAGTISSVPDFDLMQIISEIENDEEGDNDIIMAATQFEAQNYGNAVSSTKFLAKKTSPKKYVNTFAGYKFGNIGTLNIYINKN